MRIMLVTRIWPTQRAGGMAHVCFDRAVELARLGHAVHVVTTNRSWDGRARETREVEQGVHVHYMSSSGTDGWTESFAAACTGFAREFEPDLIHSDSFDRNRPWWTRLEKRPRLAITMHGFGMGGWLTRFNEQRVSGTIAQPYPKVSELLTEIEGLKSADVVLGVSRWEWRMLRDQYGLAQAKLVYNPIAPYFFEHTERIRDGGGKPKRVGVLCAAISQGQTRGFLVAQRAAAQAGIKLTVLSDVHRTKVCNHLDLTWAVVLPTSFCQGFDLTIAEARARRVPAIMTPTGSYLDEREPWDQLVEIGDVDGLAQAIARVVDPASRELVPSGAADKHRPEMHAMRWMEAIGV